MRKIEQQMNRAIENMKNWKSGNTRVEYDTVHNISNVYLHNNLIADVGDNYVTLYDGGHQSNTTKSRLNAILNDHGHFGDRVFQKDYEWFVEHKNKTIPFFSGMILQ